MVQWVICASCGYWTKNGTLNLSTFHLEIDALGSYTGGNAPLLEILVGGIVVSSSSVTTSLDTYSYTLDYTGNFPSSVSFRFNSGSGDPGDTIALNAVRVNGQTLDVSNLSTLLLNRGGSSSVSGVNHLYGRTEPTAGDLGTATIIGTDGADNLNGNNNVNGDVIDAGNGDDRVRGLGSDDAIIGGNGNDRIFGEGGNDIIIGGAGNDRLFGNDGDDIIYGGINDDRLVGGNGNDLLNGGSGNDGLLGDDGDDILIGESGADFLIGGAGNDIIYGDAGADNISGGDDNDIIFGGSEDDQIDGGNGDDAIDGGTGNDLISGADGNDTIDGEDGNDRIYGGDGDDIINGMGDNDSLYGEDGNDTISGGDGDDVIFVGGVPTTTYLTFTAGDFVAYDAGQDGAGTVTVTGSNQVEFDGNLWKRLAISYTITANTVLEFDFMSTVQPEIASIGFDNDTNFGNDSDRFKLYGTQTSGLNYAAPQATYLYGGSGTWETYSINVGTYFTGTFNYMTFIGDDDAGPLGNASYRNIRLTEKGVTTDTSGNTAYGDAGNDEIYGASMNDNLYGGTGNDIIYGGAGDDVIEGNDNDDTITGGTGADTIDGGNNNDTIILLNGDFAAGESITGGAGTDILLLQNATTVDFTTGTLATLETLTGSTGNDVVTMSASQWVNFTTIDMSGGTDTLNVLAAGDISASGTPAISGVETGNLVGTAGNDSITLTGAQLNAIITGLGTIMMGGGITDIINLTSTSVDLNTLGATDGSITGVEYVSASTAGAGVTIDLSGQSEDFNITGSSSADTIDAGSGDDTIDGGNGGDVITGGVGSDVINGGGNNDTIYALDNTVNTNAVGATFSGGGSSTVTDYSEVFASNTAGYNYNELQQSNQTNTGNWTGSDGGAANGSLTVDIHHSNGSANTGLAYFYDTITFTQTMTNVQLSFAYRHEHANQNDNGEDSYIFYDLNGGSIDYYIDGAFGSGGAYNSGWQTQTHSLGSVTAGDSFTLYLGLYHTGASGNNEDATAWFDDITITGDVVSGGGSLTAGYSTVDADAGSANVINGGAGSDTIYGSSGNDTLNGDSGTDTIYSGTVDNQTALINSLTSGSIFYSEVTGNFYQFVDTGSNLTYSAANTAAGAATLNGVNGHLATVTSAAEDTFIQDIWDGSTNSWLGMSDSAAEGVWRWNQGFENGIQFSNSGGTSVNSWYENWVAGQPNDADGSQDYGYLINDGGNIGWADAYNNPWAVNPSFVDIQGYIIEWDGQDIFAGLNSNTLNGGSGNDDLYGSDGIDIFVFDNTSSVDTVYNFNTLGRDKLDISSIISYDPLSDDITDFVQLTEGGGNTTVSIDANGAAGGSSFTNIAVLDGVTGLDIHELIAGDNLIVS